MGMKNLTNRLEESYRERERLGCMSCLLLLCWSFGVVASIHSPAPAAESLLKKIRFEKSSGNGEGVLFELDGFYTPEVFGLKGDNPRVICDFKNMRLGDAVTKVIETKGNLILRIRVGTPTASDPTIRVVLDLDPNNNYSIEQMFFKKQNIFALIIRPDVGLK